jgi:uncharacterized coiled-coil DUF342 family protein
MELIVSGAVSIATMVVGYFLGKKKQDAETRVTVAQAQFSELDATGKAVSIWRSLAEDLKREVDELRVLVNELRSENDRLREEIERLKERLISLAQEN